MDLQNQRALLTICLLAARADGTRDESERESIRASVGRIRAEGLDTEVLWSEVEGGRRTLTGAARELTTPETRELAYELAACVCNANGAANEVERAFLAELAGGLGLSSATTERFRQEASAFAEAPLAAGAAEKSASDERILRQAILCGGLELLPQRLATLAILPLQMRLVYQIGKRHGFELDRGHVKDFLGVVGVGMASQVIEGFARQLLGGLLGRGLLGGLAGGATSAGFSFATTYALGHVAERYYASGRTLSGAQLKELFTSLVGSARELQSRHAADISASARGADLGALRRLLSF